MGSSSRRSMTSNHSGHNVPNNLMWTGKPAQVKAATVKLTLSSVPSRLNAENQGELQSRRKLKRDQTISDS